VFAFVTRLPAVAGLVQQFTHEQVVICFCPVDKVELEYDDCGIQRDEWSIQNVSSCALF
jgi:hypothetical protein